MGFIRAFIIIITMFAVSNLFARGIGYVAQPMAQKEAIANVELMGITSDNGGVGIQTRYTYQLDQKITLDGGFGVAGGDRAESLFLGADYELFPDYGNQPRVSLKTSYNLAKEFEVTTHNWQIAPTFSKGISAWGYEIFPYFSVPVGLKLISRFDTYDTFISTAIGATAPLVLDNGASELFLNTELNVDIDDSFTAFFVGAGYKF